MDVPGVDIRDRAWALALFEGGRRRLESMAHGAVLASLLDVRALLAYP